MRFACSLLIVALTVPCAARGQGTTPPAAPAKADDGYSGDSTRFVVGRRVYLRSTKTFIGTIVAADAKHDFRSGRFPRPWMKAVLVDRRDGPHEWVPVEGITKLYVVR
jgi:hypothetical protein